MLLAAVDFDNLHLVLRVLYDEMMHLCGNLTGVAKGIAGLGVLFYVAAKVWQSLARAEPIDVYPLLRPFALGLCSMFFPKMWIRDRYYRWQAKPCTPRTTGNGSRSKPLSRYCRFGASRDVYKRQP